MFKKKKNILVLLCLCLIFVAVVSVLAEQQGGGCPSNQLGDGKHGNEIECTYYESGSLKSYRCSTSIYILNDTHKCCCDRHL